MICVGKVLGLLFIRMVMIILRLVYDNTHMQTMVLEYDEHESHHFPKKHQVMWVNIPCMEQMGQGKYFVIIYPLVNVYRTVEITIFNGTIEYQWPLSIVVFIYQRVILVE